MKLFLLALSAASAAADHYVFDSAMPPRKQWLHNDGYCGEVSAIMAGLKFGQYFSQYDVRDIAAVSREDVQTSKYYLVGFNDQQASAKLRLGFVEYESALDKTAKDFLAWVKAMTRRGYAVTITVYMNYYLFYGVVDPNAGEADYDHIVSVSRIESSYDDDLYHDSDVITMEDHGLWAPRATGPPYLFNYTFREFTGSRQEANEKIDGRVYTLPAGVGVLNFGIAHTGPLQEASGGGELLPVRVDTSVNYEDPEIGVLSEERPKPMPLLLTVTVSGLQAGKAYVLYRYDDEKRVPTADFNAHKGDAAEALPFEGTESGQWGIGRAIMSDEKVIYRAVGADAP